MIEREGEGGGGGSKERCGQLAVSMEGERERKRRATSGRSAGKIEWRRKEHFSIRNCWVSVRSEHWRRKLALGTAMVIICVAE